MVALKQSITDYGGSLRSDQSIAANGMVGGFEGCSADGFQFTSDLRDFKYPVTRKASAGETLDTASPRTAEPFQEHSFEDTPGETVDAASLLVAQPCEDQALQVTSGESVDIALLLAAKPLGETSKAIPGDTVDTALSPVRDILEEPAFEFSPGEAVAVFSLPAADILEEQTVPTDVLAALDMSDDGKASLSTKEEPSEDRSTESEQDSVEWSSAAEDVLQEDDWWDHADIHAARGLEDAVAASQLRQMRVIRHGDLSGTWVRPWHADESMDIYREMGMRSSTCSYVSTWMNLNNVSLMWVSEVLDEAALQCCMGEEALMNRVKLIMRPVKARLPFPAKEAENADTIGAFFGLKSSSCVQHSSSDGIRHFCLQVDVYSKWTLRLAMQKIGFREGNVLDMMLVDWPGRTVLSSARLLVTEDLLQLMG